MVNELGFPEREDFLGARSGECALCGEYSTQLRLNPTMSMATFICPACMVDPHKGYRDSLARQRKIDGFE